MVEFTNSEYAQRWLEGRAPEVQAALALRCALRTFPCTVDGASEESAPQGEIVLSAARALLTAGVTVWQGRIVRDVLSAARASAQSANANSRAGSLSARATSAAVNTILALETRKIAEPLAAITSSAAVFKVRGFGTGRYGTGSYGAADGAREFWHAATADAGLVESGDDPSNLASIALWPGDVPEGISDIHDRLRAVWHADLPTWSFWREWYDGTLAGRPIDWDLQAAVALIPDAVWQAGPAAVAEEIARIEAAFLARKLPLAEEIRVNPETGRFHVEPVEARRPELLAASLGQVADAVEDVLASPSNGLHDGSREVRVVRRVLERYGNDPQRIEMDLTSVHAGLVRQIAVEELPASEENTALVEALANAARGIRGTDPEIAENRHLLDGQAFEALSDAAMRALDKAGPVLVAASEGTLSEGLAEDFESVRDYDGRPSPFTHSREGWKVVLNRDAKYRIFGRAAQMAAIVRTSGEVLDGICAATRLSRGEVIAAFLMVVQIGISLI